MNSRSAHFYRQQDISGDEHVLLFHEGRVVLNENQAFWSAAVLRQFDLDAQSLLLLGQFNERLCLALTLSGEQLRILGAEKITPRQLLLRQSLESFTAIGLANQLLNWIENHRFCGHCGSRTIPHESERALVCTVCLQNYYPRINPCVIVLVSRGEELLLARHSRTASAYFSCLAGFMEVGETPEDTVAREVMEEVGIEVHNIRYIKSQSWPFPSQLMLGFFADYKSGAIRIDGDEIAEAGWFSSDVLPLTPSPQISVAGQLIELFLRRAAATEQVDI